MQQAKPDVHLAKRCYPSLPVLSWLREQQQHPGTLESCMAPTVMLHRLRPSEGWSQLPLLAPSFLPGKRKKAAFWKFYRMQSDKFSFWVGALLPALTSFPLGRLGFLRERWGRRQCRPVRVPAVQTGLSCSPCTQTHRSAAARATADCSDAAWLGWTFPFNFCGGEKSSSILSPVEKFPRLWSENRFAGEQLFWNEQFCCSQGSNILAWIGREKSPCNLVQNKFSVSNIGSPIYTFLKEFLLWMNIHINTIIFYSGRSHVSASQCAAFVTGRVSWRSSDCICMIWGREMVYILTDTTCGCNTQRSRKLGNKQPLSLLAQG